MKQPKVTVLMSAYNAQDFIREAVDSILNQKFKDFEFLIYEDGSSDDTLQILEGYAKMDERIRLVVNEENSGYLGFLANLNRGLVEAEGEYIARMDADDASFDHRLEKQVEYLDASPEVFLIGGGAENILEDGSHHSWYKPISGIKAVGEDLTSKNSIYHPTVMFRRDDRLKYRMHYAEDYDLWLQILKLGMQLDNLPFPVLKYRITEESLSRGNGTKTLAATILAQRVYKGELVFDDLNIEEAVKDFELGSASARNLSALFTLAYASKNYVILDEVYEAMDSSINEKLLYGFSKLKRAMFKALQRP